MLREFHQMSTVSRRDRSCLHILMQRHCRMYKQTAIVLHMIDRPSIRRNSRAWFMSRSKLIEHSQFRGVCLLRDRWLLICIFHPKMLEADFFIGSPAIGK